MGICCWIKRIGKISCLLENYQKQTAEWRRWNTVSHNRRWKFQVSQCQCISQMHSTKFHWNMCQLTNWNLNPTKLDPNENTAWIVPAGNRKEFVLIVDSASEHQSDLPSWLQFANKLTKLMVTNVLTGIYWEFIGKCWLFNCLWNQAQPDLESWTTPPQPLEKYTTMECHINGN